MYPTARSGDVVHLRSCAAADMVVGDIAAVRIGGSLYAHRVVAKGKQAGRAYIVTRADRAHQGDDGLTFDENLLGVIVGITRKGKAVPLQPKNHCWVMQGYFAARFALTGAVVRLRRYLVNILTRMQPLNLYTLFARACFACLRPRITWAVRVPLNETLGDTLCCQFAPEEFDAQANWRGRPIQRWTLELHLKADCAPAAWATFERGARDLWHAAALHVRVRYRGMGLEDLVMRKGAVILGRS
jgi:hypothetical protein